MVRRQLHADPPLASGVDDAVPLVVLKDMPAEHASPERALGMQVGRVEHDHLAHRLHNTHTRGDLLLGPRLVRGSVTPCLQNRARLSDVVVHLGYSHERIRWSRAASDAVVVRFGGQGSQGLRRVSGPHYVVPSAWPAPPSTIQAH